MEIKDRIVFWYKYKNKKIYRTGFITDIIKMEDWDHKAYIIIDHKYSICEKQIIRKITSK